MRSLIVASILVHGLVSAFADFSYGVSVLPTLDEHNFRGWMRKHKRSYGSKEEYKYRFEIYKKS